jgi:membrane-associated phospholipid phosphatase
VSALSAGSHSSAPPQAGRDLRLAADVWREAWRPTWRNRLHWLVWITVLAGELALVAMLHGGNIYDWEISLTRWIQSLSFPGWLFDITSTPTNTLALSFLAFVLPVMAVLLLVRHWAAAGILVVTLALHVLSNFPKQLVDRVRPSEAFEGITGVGGTRSFPSGHAEFVVSFYGFLAYLIAIHLERTWQRVAVVVIWLLFALATGYGRVDAGRHWPLDVFYSYAIGLAILSGTIWLHQAFLAGLKARRERNQSEVESVL